MTLERLIALACLGMISTGLVVYLVTSPRPAPAPSADASTSTASASEQPGPAPSPRDVAPIPSDTAPLPSALPSVIPLPSATASALPSNSASAAPSVSPLLTAATSTLAALAVTEVPNMTKEGRVITGDLRHGRTLERSFLLSPGKCYAALAVGIGIVDVDLMLVLANPSSGHQPQLANDTSAGPTAVLGGKGHCHKWAAPLQATAKLIVKATSGSGFVAAQLYVR